MTVESVCHFLSVGRAIMSVYASRSSLTDPPPSLLAVYAYT